MSRLSQLIESSGMSDLLHVLSRSARKGTASNGLVILPYRGYGSRKEVFLMGRVFRQKNLGKASGKNKTEADLAAIAQRIIRRGISGVTLKSNLNGCEQTVISDRDGYFRFHMRLDRPLNDQPDTLWQSLPIEAFDGKRSHAVARGDILIPPEKARVLIISDIDDTVIFTGVANKLKMVFRLFIQGAQSRIAFPGTAALYDALHHGPTGTELNPILYVSRGPWGIYEILDEFFNLHSIPIGPVLFLREWGISWRNPLPRSSRGHKISFIRRMLSLYGHLPCVLIGDSGQRDPEIYTRIVREFPQRIKAVYIRNVSRSAERVKAIHRLAKQIAFQGSSLFLAVDSFAMARHMAESGLISNHALAAVLEERRNQGETEVFQETHRIGQPHPAQTHAEIAGGALKEELVGTDDSGPPPNIVVESDSTQGIGARNSDLEQYMGDTAKRAHDEDGGPEKGERE